MWWILRSICKTNMIAAAVHCRLDWIGKTTTLVHFPTETPPKYARTTARNHTNTWNIRNIPWSNIIRAIRIWKNERITCHSHCNVMNLKCAKWCCDGMWHFVPDFQAFLDHFGTCCWVCDILCKVVNHFETENVYTACFPHCLWHLAQGWKYLKLKARNLRRSSVYNTGCYYGVQRQTEM